MIILAPAPAAPLLCVIFTPGTLPANELITLVFLFFNNSSELISETAYPKAFFSFLIPIAVTTTSFKVWASSFKVTVYTFPAPTLISAEVYPTNEITNVLPNWASTENPPSTLVTVPVPVPFTNTLAPMIGSPVASTTFPVIFFAC